MPINLRSALDAALREGTLHFYLDASVLVDIVRPETRPESRDLLEMALAKGWRCTSSVFARMEALDTQQTKEWLRRGIEAGQDPKSLVRGMSERSLPRESLVVVTNEFHAGLAQVHYFVRWRRLDRRGWEEATRLATTTNTWAPDCIHVATALRAGCNVLVTSDTFLAKTVRQKTMASDGPAKVLKELKSLLG